MQHLSGAGILVENDVAGILAENDGILVENDVAGEIFAQDGEEIFG